WGVPAGIPVKCDSGFGASLRTELLRDTAYPLLKERMAIVHTGIEHSSVDVNAEWLRKLLTPKGFQLHRRNVFLAYDYREALRLCNWESVGEAIEEYRSIRSELCSEYMRGSEEIFRIDLYSSIASPTDSQLQR